MKTGLLQKFLNKLIIVIHENKNSCNGNICHALELWANLFTVAK